MKMRTAHDRMVLGLLVTLAAACGEAGTATSDASSTGDANTTSTVGTTTGTASTGVPTTGESGTGSTTAASEGATTDMSGASASSSSGAATTEAPGTTTEAASSSAGSTGSTGTGGDPPPLTEYCDCMLSECHDQYHAKFGENHMTAEMMCIAYAESIPTIGEPAMSGDSIECYYWACMQGDCESAFGGGACQ